MKIKTLEMFPNISGTGVGTYHIYGMVEDVQIRASSTVLYTEEETENVYEGSVSINCSFVLGPDSIELSTNDIPSRVVVPLEIWDEVVSSIQVSSVGAQKIKDLALQVLLIELDKQSVFGIGIADWEVIE